MASVSKKINKISKLRKRVLASTLALSIVAPVLGPQASLAADSGNLGQFENSGPSEYTGVGAIPTYKIPAAKNQPEIEVGSPELAIKKGAKYFRDANRNGKLETYEDWRKPVKQRVKDLVERMSLHQKAGLMQINVNFGINNNPGEDGNLLTEGGINQLSEQDMRYVIFRSTPNLGTIANFNNQVQRYAEGLDLGIPVTIISNPRNHASTDYTNIGEAEGQHTFWPGALGFAAGGDAEAVHEFADIARKEWEAVGIRKIYGYTADVGTDPLWARIEDTFGENPEVAGEMIYNAIKGFQGDKLGKDSVAITVKHFPGGGARDDGLDPHFEDGKFNPYPTTGSLLNYHIPPFEKAIEAGVSSVMPYYAYPSNTSSDQGLEWYNQTEQFEEVGFALNKGILGFLRDELGFKGYVNSDTGAVDDNAWGAENLPLHEKYAKAINAGTDIVSGSSGPDALIKAVEEGLVTEETINESVTLLLTEKMNLGLFDDPYVDPQKALDLVDRDKNPEVFAAAELAHRKSVVLMRNDETDGENLLPLTEEKLENVKLYVEGFVGAVAGRGVTDPAADIRKKAPLQSAAFTASLKATLEEKFPNITLVDHVEEATHAYVFVQPMQSNWDNNPRITVGPETAIFNTDKIVEIQQKVPTITAINFTNQWLINELEPNAAALIATFGTSQDAVFDVVTGKFNPVGKLPFGIPASEDAVEREVGDVPSFAEEEIEDFVYVNAAGDKYAYNFGLSYNDENEGKGPDLKKNKKIK
ncbi:glycoside hydrolase family 3 protein [Metabacillus schmidteae]|uniref:glycoside hydrolase family 3 protein n=1 Tax=Metabacillus schmidteae TaxID=2730405 RepID=UPI00158CDCB5|nr:glycoside hydrolase family 3 N-terminal domain-containing protein [Metabacillus schmidteae]